MPLMQNPMYNNYLNANQNNNNNLNANYSQQQVQQQPQQQQSTPFGPSKVICIDNIRLQLNLHNLSETEVLSMSLKAILYGKAERKVNISGIVYNQFSYDNMIFVLSEGFDAVVTINWNPNPTLIGDINSTLFQTHNANQFQSKQIQQTQPVNPNPTPLRPYTHNNNNSHYGEECKQQQFMNNVPHKLIDTTKLGQVQDEECSEYEDIIDEIVNFVDNDPDFADFHQIPSIPNQSIVCGINTNHHQMPPLPPNGNRLNTESSFYSIYSNISDNESEIKYKAQQLQYVHSQNNVLFTNTINNTKAMSSDTSSDGGHGIEIKISDKLWNELHRRYYGQKQFESKQELISNIQSAIHINRAPNASIGDRQEWCVWIDRYYVYITENDMSTLCDVFDFNSFQNNYGQCYQSLINRKYNNHNLNVPQKQSSFRGNNQKLVKNSSRRSIISNNSSCNTSRRSVFNEKDNKKDTKHYHTIYLKPIIERMKRITNTTSIDSDYIIDIVDNSIKNGTKRQISKRTFEFKWKSYTIIMSKSLKTILDVTLSDDKNIITVHPDVVSIISKKCPILDYFTIQILANRAKLTASFTTKKNDYRQQFIYDYCGCRIVFASNHTTIVEMQCNDNSAINIKLIKDHHINSNIKY